MRVMKEIVEKFGLYHEKESDIHWLLQQRGGESAIGLPPSECPVRIKSNLMLAPHDFDLRVSLKELEAEQEDFIAQKKKCKLISFISDFSPHSLKAIYVEDNNINNQMVLARVASFSNSTTNNCRPSTTVMKDDKQLTTILKRIESSDLTSQVIYGVTPELASKVVKMMTNVNFTNVGKLIFIGERLAIDYKTMGLKVYYPTPENVEWVKNLTADDLKKLGNIFLKRHMRGI